MKKIFHIISLLVLISYSLYCVAKPLEKLTVLLDWFPNPNHAPLFVAQEQGFFKQEGLDVNLIAPADPADPPKLVAAGKADLAVDYQPLFMLQVNQGLPLVRIATLVATPLDCLVVLKSSNIHTLADLKGKTIGYSTGGIAGVILNQMLASAQLQRRDVHLINVHYDLTQALLSKKVDAVIGMMRNFELIQLQEVKQPGRAFYPEENGVPTYNELIIVANRKELHEPRLRHFIRALEHSTQYLINHPIKTWKTFAKNHPELNNKLNKNAWLTSLPRFALRPAALDNQRFIRFGKFLKQKKLIKQVLPMNKYATVIDGIKSHQ